MLKNINKILLLLLLFAMCNCLRYNEFLFNEFLFNGRGSIDQARINAISYFAYHRYKTPKYHLKRRNNKPFDVFWVKTYPNSTNSYIFSVFPEINGYVSLNPNDKLGKIPKSYFPNKFKEINGKLFIWKDSVTPLSKRIINVLYKYKVLDSINIKKEDDSLPLDIDSRVIINDDETKSVYFFICKNNIRKIKRVYSSKAFGFFKIPKNICPVN